MFNPVQSRSIHFNQNQSEWIRGQNDRINFNWKFGLDQSELGFIRIENLVSDCLGFIRIFASDLTGLGRIEFLRFFYKRVTKRFSDWFGMIRIGSDIAIGMNRNSSDCLGMNFYPILSPGLSSLVIFTWIYFHTYIVRNFSQDKLHFYTVKIP